MIPKTELNKRKHKERIAAGLVHVRVYVTPDRVPEVKAIEQECAAVISEQTEVSRLNRNKIP